MALEIREREGNMGFLFEVFWSKAQKVFFTGSKEACKAHVRNVRARIARKLKDDAMKSLGLVKVRGSLGGTYWE